jgi:hypothetical protein
MYSKRLLVALTAIFALFILAGCGGLSSVNEEDYYPRFEIKADKVSHSIFRYYTDVKECENNLETFKNKGDYYEDLLSVTRDDPLGDGTIEKAVSERDCKINIDTHIYLNVLDDNITRNNELFDKVFGYQGGKSESVFVTKYFSENDAIDYIETYIKLLEKQGFRKQLTSYVPWFQTIREWLNDVEWVKSDFVTGTTYYWNYAIEWEYGDDYTDKKAVGLLVDWRYHNYR